MTTSPRIASPIPAVVKEIIDTENLTVIVRGRVLLVRNIGSEITLAVGDKALIELIPSSREWIVLALIPPNPGGAPVLPPRIHPLSFTIGPLTIPSVVVEPTVSGGFFVSAGPIPIPSVVVAPSIALALSIGPMAMTVTVIEPTIVSGTQVIPDPVVMTATVVEPTISLSLSIGPVTIPIVVVEPDTGGGDRYLLENGTDHYLLEDSSGVLKLEGATGDDYTITGATGDDYTTTGLSGDDYTVST